MARHLQVLWRIERMAIRVENSFLVPAGLEEAWAILVDVPRVAPCIPGAEITAVIDDVTYQGVARVKLGPVQLVFNGEAKLDEVDPVARTSRLIARGGDTKGRGSVQSDMRFALAPEGEQTRVSVTTDISLAGTVAQYGRGAGVIRELCNQLTAQFARNLAAQIEGRADTAPGQAVSALGLAAGVVKGMVGRKSEG
jgi:carbon monoxide dehydrogenase subunit G